MKLVIHKYAYLKNPCFTWSIQNELGGSFTNSGPQRSLKRVLAHFKAMNPKWFEVGGEVMANLYNLDIEGQATLVKQLNLANRLKRIVVL